MITSNSEELCTKIAEDSHGVCLLSFSGGKDSLASWLQLRRYFERVVPVYCYRIPGMSFIDRQMAYYERYFGTHIIRMPHPAMYRWLNNFTFQAPENLHVIERMMLPMFDYDDVFAIIKHAEGLPEDTYTAIGVRQTDNMNRWSSIKKHGASNEKRRTFFPIYDWRKERIVAEIREARLKLGEEYRYFFRSFDGLDYRFLKPMKEHYPDDYARVLEMFPLAELELKRMEYREAYYGRVVA